MSDKEEIQIERSYLEGKPTNLKGATVHGANFDGIKNVTGARLPSSSDLEDMPEGGKSSFLGGLLSKKKT